MSAREPKSGCDEREDAVREKAGFDALDRSIVPAILGGIFHALAFPPMDWPPMVLVALVLLLASVEGKAPRAAAFRGWLYSVVFLTVGCSWIFRALGPLGGLLILLAAFFTAASMATYAFLRRRGAGNALLPLLFACSWTAFEFLRAEVWPFRNASHTLGYCVPDGPWLYLARIVGVFGLSFLLAFLAGCLHLVLRGKGRSRWGAGLAFLVILGGGWGLGGRLCLPASDEGPGVLVRFVQLDTASLEDHLRLSREALEGVDEAAVVCWPENVRRDFVLQNRELMARLEAFCRERGSALLFGARKEGPGGQCWNTAIGLSPEGKLVGDFSKRNPVPIIEWAIAPSRDGAPVPLLGHAWGPSICYDADFSAVARELVSLGAEIMVTPTRDAPAWGVDQHVQRARMLRLRAVETGRWWVRVATDGPSFLMDPMGRRRGPSLAAGARGWGGGRVWPRGERTPYVRGGWCLPWVCLLVLVLASWKLRRSS